MEFPNLKNKYAEESMFTPQEFMAHQKRIGKYPKFKPPIGIIFCYRSSLMEYILKKHNTTKVEGFYSEMYLLNETAGKVAIIGKFGIGAPAVVVLLEELIAFGVKKFISIGTAGTLQKNIPIGSLMVCKKAIRDEGTSHHYLKRSKYIYSPKDITQKIIDSLQKYKLGYFVGTSWTIDAPYRETMTEARKYQKEGVATVEMEASALFSVAQYRDVEMGVILTISDSLADSEWKPKFHLEKVKKQLGIIYKIAIDVLTN